MGKINLLVAITGATGINLAVNFLKKLKELKIETELIISKAAELVIEKESDYNINDIRNLSAKNYNFDDISAPPASGSYLIKSMVIIPCSMKTLAAIAHGYSDNLITRAADVVIKEKRTLLLSVRESPLSAIHLKNMLTLARLGVIIAPPIPSYYFRPKTIEEINNHIINRLIDQLGIENEYKRWGNNS